MKSLRVIFRYVSKYPKLIFAHFSNILSTLFSLVIAHSLSTVRHADEIIVLNNGKIVERGTHMVLMAVDGFIKTRYHAGSKIISYKRVLLLKKLILT
jgi:ABC-type transport system involved in Fe-S cluster assembly fused permease/ATPase subunit